jgi:quercetin dioxygenase-like cupin family protein
MSKTSARLVNWSDVPPEQLNPLLQRQFVHGEQAMVAQIRLMKGCVVPTHAHHNEQLSIIITGSLRFTFDPEGVAEEIVVGPGQVLVIPSNLPHKAEAVEDTLNLDIFAPPRHDWITGEDAYLR